MIARDSSVPCYRQMANIIRDNIQSGIYTKGGRIPGEMELASKYDLNRHTVRKALDQLVNEGLIYRSRGKGTFVSFPKVPYEMTRDSYFSRSIRSAQRQPRAELLDSRIELRDDMPEQIDLPGCSKITVLTILRSIEDIPAQLTTTYLSTCQFPDITQYMEDSFSLYDIMRSHYDVSPIRDEVRVECTMPEQNDMEVLQMSGQVPLLLIDSRAQDSNGEIVEISKHRSRADMYRLVFDFNGLKQ